MRFVKDQNKYASDNVRGGSEEHVVRYVLMASLCLSILSLSAIWIGRALALY